MAIVKEQLPVAIKIRKERVQSDEDIRRELVKYQDSMSKVVLTEGTHVLIDGLKDQIEVRADGTGVILTPNGEQPLVEGQPYFVKLEDAEAYYVVGLIGQVSPPSV